MGKLTLENFDEKALELLKKENYDSLDIKVYYQPDEMELDTDTIRKIWDKKENIKAETFEEVLSEEILNNWNVDESFDISEEYIVNNVLKKYVEYPIESDEYEKITEMLYEEIHDKFNYDWGTEEIYEKATVETLNVFVISNSEKRYLEDECLDVNIFTDYNNLEMNADTLNSRLNSLAFLVQSQGYELEKGFEQHEINIDNVLENAKKHFEIDDELDNNKVIVIK